MLTLLKHALISRLPSQCRVCHAWATQAVCEACIARFAQPRKRCRQCALALPGDARLCGACMKTPPALDQCLAAVSYEFPWSSLIQDYKFQSQPGLTSFFSGLLTSTPWVEPALEQAAWLIPVPLTTQSLRTRGYNQALLLARALSNSKTQSSWLLRRHETPAQHTLKRDQRLQVLRHVFTVPEHLQHHLKDQSLVLVDDVMTTGATLQAAALALRHAGAKHITGLVVARTE